jgi:hypothetical protein
MSGFTKLSEDIDGEGDAWGGSRTENVTRIKGRVEDEWKLERTKTHRG